MRRVFSPAVLLATAVYVVLTAALTWPLILHPGSRVPNDLGDPLLNTFLMAWNARVLPLTEKWWSAPQFFPVDGSMAFSEHLIGLAWITTPAIWLSGNPLFGYNAAFFLSFPLCALSAYYLTYVIARRHDCAFIAGLAFGFAPYRMAQFAHVQVLSAYWMPLALAGLHQYFQDRRRRWLALFAGGWLMQALACGNYLFYLSVLIGLWLLWFPAGRDRWRALPRVALAWMAAVLLLAPVLYGYWTYQRAYGMRRAPDEIASFSADVASVLKASDNLRLWSWLDVINRAESALFPGVTPLILIVIALAVAWNRAATERIGRLRIARVLVVAGLVFAAVAASPSYFGPWKIEIAGLRLLSVGTPHKPLSIALLLFAAAGVLHPSVRTAWRRRSALTFYALAAVAMWLFSLGPAPTLMDRPFIYKAPYAWLMLLPGVDGVRVPARFWMLAVLCLSVAAGLAIRQLGARWPRFAAALPVLACVGLLSDSWPVGIALERPPEARPIQTRAMARLELPISPVHDATVLYRATAHRRPVFNGYSGYFAPHYWALQYLVEQRDGEVLDAAFRVRPPRGGDRSRARSGRPAAAVRRRPSAGRARPSRRELHDVSHSARPPDPIASGDRRGSAADRLDLRRAQRGTGWRDDGPRHRDALARRARAASGRQHDGGFGPAAHGARRRDAHRRVRRGLSQAVVDRDLARRPDLVAGVERRDRAHGPFRRARGSAQRSAAVSLRAPPRALPPVHADRRGRDLLLVRRRAPGIREVSGVRS